ncbi:MULTISPECIES: TcpQ domain-containing protein [Gammaproteobacteria]|uniref:TcpQ domain-containing protein n=1 Tax=Gammaproteobacteria TaxID=1236 RepID=UPI000DD03494|nr:MULTISPECIES: TcpQ domain-containing protein [Gammaproteobacteria]RTE87695.1 hypothetical protein DQX04_04820 [Aliidiomarina sp. B3213]TCZ92522.1 hypothetical protein EYQ95_00475 [Lysobacter sp. N42]
MATRKKNTAKRKKSQQRAVITLVVLTIVLLVVAFIASQRMYLNESSDNRRAQIASGGAYDNLQGEISRFFGGVREAAWGRGDDKDRVIDLNEDLPPLAPQLEEIIRFTDTPLDASFRGEIKTRWFMDEDTLKTSSEQFAEEENLQVLWRLSHDYRVSAAFQVHSDLVNTMDRLARSLNSEHPEHIQAFLCPRARVILISGADEAQSVARYCHSMEELQEIERQRAAEEAEQRLQRRGLN